jgi:hypothetical protein
MTPMREAMTPMREAMTPMREAMTPMREAMTPTVTAKQKNMQEVFAAQILDAMTKANAGGMRPSFETQVRRREIQ